MSERSAQIKKLVAQGARRLLARTRENYSLDVDVVITRVRTTLNKYLLRDNQDAPERAISDFIDELQADDLCLVLACEQGDQAAWNDLVQRHSPAVRSASRSACGGEEVAEDLAQSIWAELHGLRAREDGRPASKLAYYSGRGSLAGWLRAVVGQLAVDQHRKQSRLVQTEEDADFDRLARESPDGGEAFATTAVAVNPESALSNKLTRADMEKALARAIKGLAVEDRLLVKLYYFDDLRLREAGAVLGVHEATASRRLARVHGDLRRCVEDILIREYGWTKAETERTFAEAALHVKSDLEPLLATEAALGSKRTQPRD